ncbi:MAG TPA: hypothetical protein VEO56_15235 [Bacteroidota bacterium]|nr:hypothetical protein [Bacteroidota bacterium]
MNASAQEPSPERCLFTHENVLAQLEKAPYSLGYYTLRFYSEEGKPVNRVTATISEYYLYPSGGTLRDSAFNIVSYDSRYDTYRGFRPPHLNQPDNTRS